MGGDAKPTLGFIVNPIAGMGGAVGLKGTDGPEILERAIKLGARPVAPVRAKEFLKALSPVKTRIRLVAAAGNMGEIEAKESGFEPIVVGEAKAKTTPEDTKDAARRMADMEVDLLVFCGGDGTARDVLDAVGMRVPVLGVPTGVKMHSAIFAVNPEAAARIAMRFLWGELPLKEGEVMDVDEEAYRAGRLSAKLYGYVMTPYEPSLIQGMKIPSPVVGDEEDNKRAIARYIVENMENGVVYIIGPGTTTRPIAEELGLEKTLLGVDIVQDGRMLVKDANETEILRQIEGKKAKIIVTPIGGQGFIFGRGNQQISPKVIRKVGRDNILVVATKGKMSGLKRLRVDTGDPEVDEMLRGYLRVVVDYGEEVIVQVE
ncbi:ATP-NAD kinase [Candidatus Bathyarchaeota archaeon]|nr:MAG: ATP-NAD kinase [Candidatus Bathyarchaeota archaeon]